MVNENKTDLLRAVGRHKTASARVRISEGEGNITINGKKLSEFFPHEELQGIVMNPLEVIGKKGKLDVSAKVAGGGIKGQANAIQLGLARSLVKYDEEFKKTLKSNGYLTRDSRSKERKKPGLKKARRAPQWKKR